MLELFFNLLCPKGYFTSNQSRRQAFCVANLLHLFYTSTNPFTTKLNNTIFFRISDNNNNDHDHDHDDNYSCTCIRRKIKIHELVLKRSLNIQDGKVHICHTARLPYTSLHISHIDKKS